MVLPLLHREPAGRNRNILANISTSYFPLPETDLGTGGHPGRLRPATVPPLQDLTPGGQKLAAATKDVAVASRSGEDAMTRYS